MINNKASEGFNVVCGMDMTFTDGQTASCQSSVFVKLRLTYTKENVLVEIFCFKVLKCFILKL